MAKDNPKQLESVESMSLLDYLELLTRHKKTLLRNTAIGLIAGLAIAFSLPKKYEAVAMILPPQQDSGLMGLLMGQMGNGMANVASDLLGKATPAELYASILQTDAISDKIIDRFKLIKIYKEDNRKDTYDKLNKYVDIVAGKKDGIVSITVEDKDAVRAADIANAYVEEVIRLTAQLSKNDSQKNSGYLYEQLTKAKANLANAEDKIKMFQLKNKAINITEQAKGTFKGIGDLMSQLALEEVKMAAIKRQFTDNSQEVKSEASIISNIKRQISKLEYSTGNSAVPSISTVPAIGQEYVRLLREFRIQEMLVEALTKQLEVNKLEEFKDFSAVQVIQKARPADKESKPKPVMLVAATTFFVMFFTIIYAYLHDRALSMSDNDRERWHKLIQSLRSFRTKSGLNL